MYAKQLCKANRTVALDPYKPSARTKPELNKGRDLDRKTRLLIHIFKGDHVSYSDVFKFYELHTIFIKEVTLR